MLAVVEVTGRFPVPVVAPESSVEDCGMKVEGCDGGPVFADGTGVEEAVVAAADDVWGGDWRNTFEMAVCTIFETTASAAACLCDGDCLEKVPAPVIAPPVASVAGTLRLLLLPGDPRDVRGV